MSNKGRNTFQIYKPQHHDSDLVIPCFHQDINKSTKIYFRDLTDTLWDNKYEIDVPVQDESLPQSKDLNILEEEVIIEIDKLMDSGRIFLVDHKLDDQLVESALVKFQSALIAKNDKTNKVSWVSPFVIFHFPSVEYVQETRSRDLNEVYNDVFTSFNPTRPCPIISDIISRIKDNQLTKKMMVKLNSSEYDFLRECKSNISKLKIDYIKGNVTQDEMGKLRSKWKIEMSTEQRRLSKLITLQRKSDLTESGVYTVKYNDSQIDTFLRHETFNWEKKSMVQADKIFDGDYGVLNNFDEYLNNLLDYMLHEIPSYRSRNNHYFDNNIDQEDFFGKLNIETLQKYSSFF